MVITRQHLRKRHWTSSPYITIPSQIGITAVMLLAILSYAWLSQIMLGCSEGIINGNIFIVVAVSVVMQDLLNNAVPCREIVVCFYLANEGLSLLENIAEILPIPQKIKDVLLQLRDKASVVKETVMEEKL